MAKSKTHRQTRQYDDDENDFTTCNWMEYALVVVLSCILLLAALVLVIFWTLYSGSGYGWHESSLDKQFNLHPTLMIAGFVTISGFSMLLYRISRCCRHVFVKLFHTLFHIFAIPCIALGFFAVFDFKMLQGDNHFHSLHSWMGLVTMGMFALQFVFGFISFLVLLCCEGATGACRAAFVPIHASFGTTIFMLAVATSLTGLTQKLTKQNIYSDASRRNEIFIVNALAMVLVALGILLSYVINRQSLRVNKGDIISERL